MDSALLFDRIFCDVGLFVFQGLSVAYTRHECTLTVEVVSVWLDPAAAADREIFVELTHVKAKRRKRRKAQCRTKLVSASRQPATQVDKKPPRTEFGFHQRFQFVADNRHPITSAETIRLRVRGKPSAKALKHAVTRGRHRSLSRTETSVGLFADSAHVIGTAGSFTPAQLFNGHDQLKAVPWQHELPRTADNHTTAMGEDKSDSSDDDADADAATAVDWSDSDSDSDVSAAELEQLKPGQGTETRSLSKHAMLRKQLLELRAIHREEIGQPPAVVDHRSTALRSIEEQREDAEAAAAPASVASHVAAVEGQKVDTADNQGGGEQCPSIRGLRLSRVEPEPEVMAAAIKEAMGGGVPATPPGNKESEDSTEPVVWHVEKEFPLEAGSGAAVGAVFIRCTYEFGRADGCPLDAADGLRILTKAKTETDQLYERRPDLKQVLV